MVEPTFGLVGKSLLLLHIVLILRQIVHFLRLSLYLRLLQIMILLHVLWRILLGDRRLRKGRVHQLYGRPVIGKLRLVICTVLGVSITLIIVSTLILTFISRYEFFTFYFHYY